jgi:xylulokinase
VFTVSDEPTADASGAVAGFADATGRYLPLVCTLNATKVTDTVARLLAVEPDELDELALAAPPGADGVVLVPYFDGERTPNRPEASGVLAGLRSGVTPEQVARAAYEGVVCGLLEGLDALTAQGLPADGRLVLVGGGSRSLAYRQVFADLTGRTVEVADGERVAIGACVQAASLLTGASTDEIAGGWGLLEAEEVEPTPDVDIESVRAAYREVAGLDAIDQAPPATAGGTKSEQPDSSG